MKRYNEFTREEQASLTSEQIERLIDLEIAFAGILPVERPIPVTEFKPAIEATDVAYEVFNVLFRKQEDATAVAGMEVLKSEYDYYGAGCNYCWLTERTDYDSGVKTKHFYKKEDVIPIKEAIKDSRKKQEAYKKEDEEYEKYLKSISSIRDEVYSACREAARFMARVEKAQQVYNKHLDLAENNVEIAMNFFKDAYKNDTEIANAVFPDLFPEKKEDD
jgi:hypothetical protein